MAAGLAMPQRKRASWRGEFSEAWFYPLYGAYRALARDFDLDGDMDIAAIAFFPNYLGSFKESFTYLENQGGLKFTPSTFPESISGRWITMDAGDWDGDGDADIVLGAFNRSFDLEPEAEIHAQLAVLDLLDLQLHNQAKAISHTQEIE